MLLSLVLVNAAIQPANYLVQTCGLAHARLDKGAVEISVKTVGAASSETADYILDYDRSVGADLKIKRKRPMQIVVTKDTVFEYDASTKQYSEKPRFDGELSSTLKHSAGVLDELVASLVDKDGVSRWLSEFKKSTSWRFRSSGEQDLTVEAGDSDGRISVTIDARSKLLKSVSMKSDKYGTDWKFKYGTAPREIAFVVPPGSYKTNDIRPDIAPPTYSSAEAKRAVESVFAKYDNPKELGYQAGVNGELTSVWIDHGRIRQQDESSDWTLAGGKLTLLDLRRQQIVVGPSTLTRTVDAVAKSGTRVEPLLKLMMRGINPFRFYFGQNCNVSVTGSTKIDGKACTLLEASSPVARYSLVVRSNDGFVLSLASISASGNGDWDSSPHVYKELRVDPGMSQGTTRQGWPSIKLDDYVPISPN